MYFEVVYIKNALYYALLVLFHGAVENKNENATVISL
jgi:hypothetical protein